MYKDIVKQKKMNEAKCKNPLLYVAYVVVL